MTVGENSQKLTNETATVVKFRFCSYLPIWLDDTVDDHNQTLNNYDFRKTLPLKFLNFLIMLYLESVQQVFRYSRLSLNGHLCKTDTSVKRTVSVGPCLYLLPLFESL